MLSKKLLNFIVEGRHTKFYDSREWKHKRKEILARDNNECQRCKREGRFSVAECVHHIQHLGKHPLLALDSNNLVSLCNICHNKEHPEKFKKKFEDSEAFENEERW